MATIYDVLRRPIITEKSNYQSGELAQYVFEVDRKATKAMIRDAVETVFDVEVLRVNVINVPAKRSRSAQNRSMRIRKSAYKKAIVTLSGDSRIEIFEGVK